MSKRASPMSPGSHPGSPRTPGLDALRDATPQPGAAGLPQGPPTKKLREDNAGVGAPGGGSGAGDTDPNELGDVLNAAGVDLREEESLLSGGLLSEPGGLAGARLLHAPRESDHEGSLLNYELLRRVVARTAAEQGLALSQGDQVTAAGVNQDPLSLISTSCEEWLADILNEAAAYSRHRRLAMNATSASEVSDVNKALRHLVHRDRDSEQKYKQKKMQLGIGPEFKDGGSGSGDGDKEKDSEESIQRAANDTARMMTAAVGRKKKFSWMREGGGVGASPLSGPRRQPADPSRFKEVREENGIAMRDLLPALESKRMGVRRTLMRGYAKLRN